MVSETLVISLDHDLVAGIDTVHPDRGEFIAEAVRNELARRRRRSFLESLASPHPESMAPAETHLGSWPEGSSDEDAQLLEPGEGRPVRWVPDAGWVDTQE
jgi:hypothetical protein